MSARMKQDVTLSLHIPEARFRPGDTPDFSYLQLPKAGAAARPPVDAKASETRDHRLWPRPRPRR